MRSLFLLGAIFCLFLEGCQQAGIVGAVAPSSRVSSVIPLPEAENQSSSQPIDAIIVDKNGQMGEAQYYYDPAQGGVVINNYNDLAGDGSSIFFPAFEVGLLWWGGYWVDHDGYYWDGHQYQHVNNPKWHDDWNHYWNHQWKGQWKQYQERHPQGIHGESRSRSHFDHNRGTTRPANVRANKGGRR